MMSPNPTSRFRLFTTSTIRITVLLSLIAIAATVLATTSSSARSLGQRLFAGAATIITGGKTAPGANVAPANHALTAESEEAAAPIESSTLIVERRAHTATRLSDGRVLIAGGENASGALNETELYNPSSGTFSAAANMSTA